MSRQTLIPTVILIFLIPSVLIMVLLANAPGGIASPAGEEEPLPQKIMETLGFKSPLTKTIEVDLKGFPGQYAVAVKNLKTGQEHYTNKNQQFAAASLYKLWVMAVAFEKIKQGDLKEDEILQMPGDQLDEMEGIIPSGRGIVSISVADTIERMITVSDNDAAILLYTRLGNEQISNFLESNGFKGSTFDSPPKTSAKDIANFYEKLYKGTLIDRQYSDKMLALLKRQRINDKLPKYLPGGTKIAHKTGELDTFEHDAGIVFTQTGDYLIVVLTEADDPQLGSEAVARLSKTVFDFFNNQQKH